MTLVRRATFAFALTLLAVASAHADRRYFLQSYTPYLAPAGNLELEVWSTALSGQGDTTGTAWQNRIEFEYAVTDRLTGAFYLNFVQPPGPGSATAFDGPSLEWIYRLAEPGRLPVDAAGYLELRANGTELEIEPKLLLAHRVYRLVSVLNVIGEFERHTAGEESGETEKSLRLTAGTSREIGEVFAFGVEAAYAREFSDEGEDASSVQVGPTINLQTPKVQVTVGWHPQVSGQPATARGLNLRNFPRSEVRLLLGIEL